MSKAKEGDSREGDHVHRVLRNHPIKESIGSYTQKKYECSISVTGL